MSSKGAAPPTQPTLPVQNQIFAAANQNQPVIYFSGTQQLASYWLTDALDERKQQAAGSPSKK